MPAYPIRYRLKAIVTARRMSFGHLGRISGIDHRRLRRIANGPPPNLTMHTLARLAAALEVPICDLFDPECLNTVPSREDVA